MMNRALVSSSRSISTRALSTSAVQSPLAKIDYRANFAAIAEKLPAGSAARAEVSRLEGLFIQADLAFAENVRDIKPIDFQKYRDILGNEPAIAEMEAALKAFQLQDPAVVINGDKGKPAMKTLLTKSLDEAKKASDFSASEAKRLATVLAEYEATRTTRDTTVEEIAARYPEVAAKLKDDIENKRWGKGLGMGAD